MIFDEMEYKRIDVDEAVSTLKKYRIALENAANYDDAKKAFIDFDEYCNQLSYQGTIAQIRHDIDTREPFYKEENMYWMEASPITQNETELFIKACNHSVYKEQLKKDFGEIIFINAEISEKAFDEKLIPDIQKENKLAQSYEELLASAQIPFEGNTYTLSQMEPFQNDADDARRLKAWKAVGTWYKENQSEMDRIYDELVKVRDEMAKKMGYDNYCTLGYYRMNRNCWDRNDIEKFREAIVKYIVPVTQKIYEAQAKRLHVSYPMSFADAELMFRDGNPKPKGSMEDILQAGMKFYSELSPETKEFYTTMMDMQLMNVASTAGKAGGGYCTDIPVYRVPFIFANFNGTQGDVDVITHEAGHAFACWMNRNRVPRSTIWPTYEACECHSMSMEFFAEKWAEDFFGDDAQKYRYAHLASALRFLPYGTCVDHFQHEMYDHPEYTSKQRHEVWKKLMGIYMPWYRLDGEIPFFADGEHWQLKHHIYSSPFYYIDYCLAQTVALEFWELMSEDFEKAWEIYMAYTKLGGSDTWLNMLKTAGLDSPLESGTLQNVARKSMEWLEKHDISIVSA